MKRDPGIEVFPVASNELGEALALLEEFLRGGEPLPRSFVERLKEAVGRGELEVLVARTKPGGEPVGAISVSFRLNVSAGGVFASIEDLYVRAEARRRGAGRALVEAVGARCKERGVSYVEVQTDDEAAPFYEALGYEREPGVRVLSRTYPL